MGARLARKGHKVVGFDIAPEKLEDAQKAGVEWSPVARFSDALEPPRVVIMMVAAGETVDAAIGDALSALSPGDVLIDGGNSFYKDSIRRAQAVEERGMHMLDMGVSGGVWGLEQGYCLMVGGGKEAFDIAEPVLKDLAPDDGYAYVGPSGAGHYAKMVHNGIEYGMLQAYGEGFEILKESPYDYDLARLSGLWNHGSVVRSWLLELAEMAFKDSPDLEDVRGWVEDSGEGRWTVLEAIEERVPAPVIALSLMMRFRSRQDDSFSAKTIAALRKQFGGHEVRKL
jgi:6-phosphogluconate dehydrogenase